MRTLPIEKFVLDVCDACGGVWCDHEELKHIAQFFSMGIESTLDKFHPILERNSAKSTVVQKDYPHGPGVVCPTDRMVTERYVYAGDSRIILDRCPTCFGVWFDGNELKEMAEYLKPNARFFMGKLMVEEMKATERMSNELEEALRLPIALAGSFVSPMAFLATVASLLVKLLLKHPKTLKQEISHPGI